jgi:hypothetical protein
MRRSAALESIPLTWVRLPANSSGESVGFFGIEDEPSAAIAVESIALELVSESRFQEIGALLRIGLIGKNNGVVDCCQAGSIILRHPAQLRQASPAVSSPLGCSTGKA